MQTVCVVNESENAALQKASRILCKYLPQTGSRTYLGSISQEGLQDLQEELIAQRSRHMSVVAFLVKRNHSTTVLFTVGSTRSFDVDKGIYAFRERSVPYTVPAVKKSGYFQLVDAMLRMSALFHDLGKYNDAFQAKLGAAMAGKSTSTREFIRHDAMSYFYLTSLSASVLQTSMANATDSLCTLSETQLEDIFKVLSDPQLHAAHHQHVLDSWAQLKPSAFRDQFDQSINSLFSALREASSPHAFRAELTPSGYIYLLILTLVLTHHKLTEAKEVDTLEGAPDTYASSFVGYFKAFENLTCTAAEEQALYRNTTTFSKGIAFSDNKFCAKVNNVFEILQKQLTLIEPSVDSYAMLAAIVMHFARPLLIMSDHLASIQKTDPKPSKGRYVSNDVAIANTFANLNAKKEAMYYPGDAVSTHLESVANYSRKVATLALSGIQQKQDSELFPRVPLGKLTTLKDMLLFPSPEKFQWQQDAFDYIQGLGHASQKFVAVIAETGSGKTIASAKILAAMQPQKDASLRYTYALGLRSLTLQTGKSYQDDLGFSDKQLAILLGDAVQKKLALSSKGAASSEQAEPSQLTGAESLELEEDFDAISTGHNLVEGKWYDYIENNKSEFSLAKEFSKNVLSLVDTPVVVCTVDQLIDVSYLARVGKARLFLRLMNSDLVLDEVDNYSLEQIPAICRLIYLSALFGNSVICMSATLSPFILQTLVHAFNEGRRACNALKAEESRSAGQLIQVSNIYRAEAIPLPDHKIPATFAKEVLPELSACDVWQAIMAYNHAVVDIINTRDLLKNVLTMPFEPKGSLKELYASFLTQITDLHAAQKQEVVFDTEQGSKTKDISVGFIKFNSVADARKFTRYLLECELALPEDTEITTLCYHSKFSNFELNQIDAILNTIANRKKLNNEFLSEAAKRKLQPFVEAIPQRNLIVVVVTTSILETGRDHDYDWCIVEPSSTRSLIQTAGRIYRHRELTTPASNVCLMGSLVKHMVSKVEPQKTPSAPSPFTAPLRSHAGILKHLDVLPASLTKIKGYIKKVLNEKDTSLVFGDQSHSPISNANALSVLMADPARQQSLPFTATEEHILAYKMLSGSSESKQKEGASQYFYKNMVFSRYAYRERFRDASEGLALSILPYSPDDSSLELTRTMVRRIDAHRLAKHEDATEIQIEPLTVLHPYRNLRGVNLTTYDLTSDIKLAAKAQVKELKKHLTNAECATLFQYNLTMYTGSETSEYAGTYHPLLGFDKVDSQLPEA